MRRLVLMLSVVALAGCGSKDEPEMPATTSTAAAPAAGVTPFPSIDGGDIEPGTEYTTQLFKPNITFTLPEGEWTAFGADSPDHVEIETDGGQAGFGFHHMTQVFDAEKGGKTPGDAEPGPPDFAAWLTSHPHLTTTKPKPVEALGLKGVSIDVRTKSAQPEQYRDCGKYSPPCVVFFVGKIEPVVMGGESRNRMYILEQDDDKQLVVEMWTDNPKTFDDHVKVAEGIVAGATTAGG